MTIRKIKNKSGKCIVFTCAFSIFAILPVFSSQAASGPASGPASEIQDSFREQQQEAGPGSTGTADSQTAAGIGTGIGTGVTGIDTGITEPVYPVVKEVDKYSYEQMEQDIEAFEVLYKDKVKIEVLGTTHDGRNIYDIIVGNAGSDKQIVIQGGIHAREYITSLLVMKQAGETLQYYDSAVYGGRTYSDMLSQAAIHFVPMVNPDGIAISQFGEGAIRSPELRQGVQLCYQADVVNGVTSLDYGSYLVRWKSNARGVDLNRNYDADWHQVGPEAYPSNSGYKGPAPFSEPESLALAYLLLRDQVKACLNYHSMGQVIYWDVAGNKQRDASYALARQYSGDSGYRLLGEYGKGGVKDWVQIKELAMPSITVEVGSSAAPVPFGEFPAIWQQNHQAPGRMLAFVLG